MQSNTPEEVFRAISADFRQQGLTHEKAAEILGFKSRQSLSNLLSSKKYLSGMQANKFQKAFGYNLAFLTKGEGELREHKDNADNMQELLQNITTREDMQLVFSWFLEAFSALGNTLGLAIWAEAARYIQARKQLSRETREIFAKMAEMGEKERTENQKKVYERYDILEKDATIRIQKILDEMKAK